MQKINRSVRQIDAIVQRLHDRLGTGNRQSGREICATSDGIAVVEDEAVEQVTVMRRDRGGVDGRPSSAMIFAVGPLIAAPPTIGETAITGARHRAARRQRRHGEDRVDAQERVRRTDDHPGESAWSLVMQAPRAAWRAPQPRLRS